MGVDMATRTQWMAKCTLAGAALVLLASCDRTPTEVDIPDGGVRPIPLAPSAAHGPHSDAFGYTAFRVPFTFNDISTTGTTVLNAVDDVAVPVPIGFTFSFYGVPHTTVFVSTNALLTFGAGNPGFVNQDFSGPVIPDLPSIAPLWDDWVTFCSEGIGGCTEDDRVVVQTVGQPGQRQFIVQWHFVPHFFTSPSPVTFQAVLYEGTNHIEFRYLDTDTGDGNAFGASATVGIRDVAGHLNGRFIAWSHNQPVIPNRSAILIVLLPESGKVTGGGQIDVPGGKGSFGFNAKLDNGAASGQASGHLNYLNHVSRVHLDCTVTNFTVLTPTMARFNGTCSSKSYTGTFMAEVEDNGKSGKNDVFRITYGSPPVTEGGPLRSGNIQIHQ